MIGWVAKSRTPGSSFSVAKYGPQQKTDPIWPDFGNGVKPDGTMITNNDPNDTCMPIDESWTSDWVKYLVGKFGNAAHGGVAIYALDNEPTWWDKMHRDVHPLPFTYDEVTEKGLKVAKAIKAADPTAEVSGPVIDFWLYLLLFEEGPAMVFQRALHRILQVIPQTGRRTEMFR